MSNDYNLYRQGGTMQTIFHYLLVLNSFCYCHNIIKRLFTSCEHWHIDNRPRENAGFWKSHLSASPRKHGFINLSLELSEIKKEHIADCLSDYSVNSEDYVIELEDSDRDMAPRKRSRAVPSVSDNSSYCEMSTDRHSYSKEW